MLIKAAKDKGSYADKRRRLRALFISFRLSTELFEDKIYWKLFYKIGFLFHEDPFSLKSNPFFFSGLFLLSALMHPRYSTPPFLFRSSSSNASRPPHQFNIDARYFARPLDTIIQLSR